MFMTIKALNVINADNVRRFRAEIILLKELHHPNIVAFVGCYYSKTAMALVMELVPNGTVADALHNTKLYLPT